MRKFLLAAMAAVTLSFCNPAYAAELVYERVGDGPSITEQMNWDKYRGRDFANMEPDQPDGWGKLVATYPEFSGVDAAYLSKAGLRIKVYGLAQDDKGCRTVGVVGFLIRVEDETSPVNIGSAAERGVAKFCPVMQESI